MRLILCVVVFLVEALVAQAAPLDRVMTMTGDTGGGQPLAIDQGSTGLWQRLLKRVGIEGLRFHDLRHEAISRLVEAGLSDQEVAAISGHKSMQMLRRYTHLRAEDLVARLDRLRL